MHEINNHTVTDFDYSKPFSEKIKSVPGLFGIRPSGDPEYFLIRSNGMKQIRKYSDVVMASIVLPVERDCDSVQTAAYEILSHYFFGHNQSAQKIAMTLIVFYEEKQWENGESALKVSFVLPGNYSIEKAPLPLDPRIKLYKKSSQMVACLSYSGPNDKIKVQKYSDELKCWLQQFDSYKAVSDIQVAEYYGPSTISFFKKNEVHIDLKGC